MSQGLFPLLAYAGRDRPLSGVFNSVGYGTLRQLEGWLGRFLRQWDITGLSLQLAKRMKDSDRDDFLDVLGSENEGKLKSPPAQQVRKEEGQVVGRASRKGG